MEESPPRATENPVAARAVADRSTVVDVGLLVATSPGTDTERMSAFAARLAGDAADELEAATEAGWRFHAEEPESLADADARRPSQFLDEAALRMVEGPYDLVAVVTDVPLLSRNHRRVAGLASPLSRVAVVSTYRLRVSGRDRPRRPLDSAAVRWNGATALLHQIGHVLGAGHDPAGGVMAPYEFDPDRASVPEFAADVSQYLERIATTIPEEEVESRSVPWLVWFHLLSAARNGRQLLRALATSRAPCCRSRCRSSRLRPSRRRSSSCSARRRGTSGSTSTTRRRSSSPW
ncbi:hypothetical protein ACFQL4_04740 [Halosimplex aquaticum]